MEANPDEPGVEASWGGVSVGWLRNHPPRQAQTADNFQELKLRIHSIAKLVFSMKNMCATSYGYETITSMRVGLCANIPPQLSFCT